MASQLLRDSEGRTVLRVVTESGVVGYIATCVSRALMADMAAKLRRKLARRLKSVADPELRAAIAQCPASNRAPTSGFHARGRCVRIMNG